MHNFKSCLELYEYVVKLSTLYNHPITSSASTVYFTESIPDVKMFGDKFALCRKLFDGYESAYLLIQTKPDSMLNNFNLGIRVELSSRHIHILFTEHVEQLSRSFIKSILNEFLGIAYRQF